MTKNKNIFFIFKDLGIQDSDIYLLIIERETSCVIAENVINIFNCMKDMKTPFPGKNLRCTKTSDTFTEITSMEDELKYFLQQNFDIPEVSLKTDPGAHQWLAEAVNRLLNNNFEKLVSILYRIDVSEEKLKMVLKKNPGADAGNIIADLIIERQLQKIKSRKKPASNDSIPDEEKW